MKTEVTNHEIVAAYAALCYFRMHVRSSEMTKHPNYSVLSDDEYEILFAGGLDELPAAIEESLVKAMNDSESESILTLEISEREAEWLKFALRIVDLTAARSLEQKIELSFKK